MATRKMRKFNEGGVTEEDLSAANKSEDAIATLNARKRWTDTEEAPARKQSFKEAFAQARSGGEKTFEWNGKKYTTELASDKKAAPARQAPKAAPVTDTGDEVSRLKSRAPMPVEKPKYETSYDRMNRRNREEAMAQGSAADRAASRIAKGRAAAAEIMPRGEFKKGGSVKGWGIARGARKAKIV